MEKHRVEDFSWPSLVPSGQRNPNAKSNVLATSAESVTLSYSDGREFELTDEDSGFDEYLRLCLLCGIFGVWSGAKNNQHTGYVLASMTNFPEESNDDKELNDAIISVTWKGKKFPVSHTVHDLMRLVNFIGKLLFESYQPNE